MQTTILKLEQLIQAGQDYFNQVQDTELSFKPGPLKWSKKEILGHLIDSAINNLQRFTEIQYEDKPYTVRTYKQDELVQVNRYQEASLSELLEVWSGLNRRIVHIMKQQDAKTLAYEIRIGSEGRANLLFLMQDYVEHMQHHMQQILSASLHT